MKRKSAEKAQRRLEMSNNYVNQRKKMVYDTVSQMISGNVLLVGADKGFDISIFATAARSLTIVDKTIKELRDSNLTNVEYHFIKFPSLSGLTSNHFDFVVSLQAIEHISDDFLFMQEVSRVLKSGGKLIISTPNKAMSLTRNPWHKREYTVDEFKNLLGSYFSHVDAMGVFGRENVMEYYQKNLKSVKAFTRMDAFNFQKYLPNFMLKLPYHLLNRLNRRKLLVENRTLTLKISASDYYLDAATEQCFDLFFVAQK